MESGPRSSRSTDFDQEEVLAALGRARRCLVEVQSSLRPRSGLSRSAGAVIAEIDEFAFVLTGQLNYFHLKAHGSPARRGTR
ncbi:MAG: hypothetical protein JJ866_06180 [Roseibium sp.]|uniref:hypothetical protein n=1 Tax=Roseibium sp. TaxID=1936156 RepID=UPI001B28C484|nr:hypothetical protein [Roseibium sp.]MBO6891511.1 hypothetical protein [Roseibium sp.]MBO6929051.1 hypothetical protein [Roseibium sp.]